MRSVENLGTLTVLTGAAASNTLAIPAGADAPDRVTVFGPAAMDGTMKIQVGPEENTAAADMRDLSINGVDTAILAGDAVVIPAGAFRSIRVTTSINQLADRVLQVRAEYN